MPRQLVASLIVLCMATTTWGADIYKLPSGEVKLQSVGPLAFGPDGILLIGDNKAATVYGVQTGDKTGDPASVEFRIQDLPGKLSALLGGTSEVQDMAVNPQTGNLFVAVVANGKPSIVKIDGKGDMKPLDLSNIPVSKLVIPNAPEDKVVGEGRRARNNRGSTITDLAFVDGQVILSGLSASDAPSNVRTLGFPFTEGNEGANLEIFHAAHGRVEDYAPIRTFVPFVIDGKPNVLAGFVCTPLVRFPLDKVGSGGKVEGTTVAELGNRNQPIDMIAYKKDGKDFLLLANSARGVMKISTDKLDENPGLTQPVGGGGTAGQPFETVEALAGTVQLDKLNDESAIILVRREGDRLDLETVPLP